MVALLFDGGGGVGAQATYTDVCDVPAFVGSEEQRVAYQLLYAYREKADAADIKRVCEASQELTFLGAVRGARRRNCRRRSTT